MINQDDTYSDAMLSNHNIITFKSISSDIDPDTPIEDHLDLLPDRVQVMLRVRAY